MNDEVQQIKDKIRFVVSHVARPPHSAGNPYQRGSDFFIKSISAVSLILVFVFGSLANSNQEFVNLAQAFLDGRTYLSVCPNNSCLDFSLMGGRYYWPLGPLPAVILMPFVYFSHFFNFFFYQNYLNFLLVLLIFGLIFRIGRRLGYSSEDSYYWSFAFCFATAFIAIAFIPSSWYLSHTIATLLLFVLIYIYLRGKANLWLLSLISGLLLMTRITAGLSAIIFVLYIVFQRLVEKIDYRQRLKTIFSITPLLCCLIIIFAYNYVRFGTLFESGYSFQLTSDFFLKARSYGLYNLIHLPGNLYYALLSGPLPVFQDNLSHVLKFPFIQANTWGMSIFITSPYLLYLFFIDYKDQISKVLLAISVLTALTIFSYFGIGWWQFGYRYSLDFLPFLFFLLMRNYPKRSSGLSSGFKLTIFASALFNFYLFGFIFLKEVVRLF